MVNDDMPDDTGWISDDDFEAELSSTVDPEASMYADVSGIDAQDTVDVSAQFIRVCARIYEGNPFHNPIYRWLNSLPRNNGGNLRDISSHLAMALRLYVDILDSGQELRLGPVNLESIEDGRVQRVYGRMVQARRPDRTSVSEGYLRSRNISEALDARDKASGHPPVKEVNRDVSRVDPNKNQENVSSAGPSSGVVSKPVSVPASGSGEAGKNGGGSDRSGLAFVAGLTKDEGEW